LVRIFNISGREKACETDSMVKMVREKIILIMAK
jgi:hypothetical protein